MPLYEYHCPGCDRIFEKIVNRQPNEVRCPNCGEPAERKVSAFAAAGLDCSAPSSSGFG
ncbi:MAG: zinc ribbon domain-containing protein [Desulfuromonadales bacterium]